MAESSPLEKSIAVRAYNRPIKVAYLIPAIEDTRTHWIIDAVFYESYTRWGGANTLIVPTKPDSFDGDGYERWLEAFDPDFIYSYVDLEQAFIGKLAGTCLPISFLPHRRRGEPETRWRDFSPDWGTYFNSVKSLSTLLSPYANPARSNRQAPTAVKTLLTQALEPPEARFFPDNFGVSHDVGMVTHAVPGLYETLCHVGPKQPGSRMVYGSREVESPSEILSEIATGNVYTFATLARIHSDGLNRLESHTWGRAFLLFVGETCKDRISFWNSRLLVPRWIDVPGSLIVAKTALEDELFVTALGQYFNKFNFSRGGNGQPSVEIRSLSVTREELTEIQAKFNRKTWSQLSIPANFDALVFPSEREVEEEGRFFRRNPIIFRLNESSNEIQAVPPEHFEYNIGAFSHLNGGAWAIDLDIERHNNLSKYSNVTDTWQLPRNLRGCAAFTNRLSKVSSDHLLTVLPAGQDTFPGDRSDRKRTYDLKLPTDLNFFRHLVVSTHPRDTRDLRHGQNNPRYVGLDHSDKGQNLRGVVSMFDRFEEAYQLLTNKLWRDALRKYGRVPSVKESQIHGLIPGDRDFKTKYAEKHRVDRAKVTQYIQSALSDALEYLVERGVFYQVHSWRCTYCGHANSKVLDDLKKENSCSICKTKYFVPIDLSWEFSVNSFVAESLAARNGLTVLWALGYLHQSIFQGSFYFLPEANLFYEEAGEEKHEEIDILSVGNGEFLVGEVKRSATTFLRKEGDIAKFVSKIKALKPDIALLIFEEFAQKPEEVEQTKKDLMSARETILKETGIEPSSLKIVVASETRDFSDYGRNFGVDGPRLHDIWFNGRGRR